MNKYITVYERKIYYDQTYYVFFKNFHKERLKEYLKIKQANPSIKMLNKKIIESGPDILPQVTAYKGWAVLEFLGQGWFPLFDYFFDLDTYIKPNQLTEDLNKFKHNPDYRKKYSQYKKITLLHPSFKQIIMKHKLEQSL